MIRLTKLLAISLTLVALTACSKKESTVSASTNSSIGAPFDEMHTLFCKTQSGGLSQTETIRLAEITTEVQNKVIEIMKLNNTEAIIKNQEITIKMAKAINKETCDLSAGNVTPLKIEPPSPPVLPEPMAPIAAATAPAPSVDDSPFMPSFDCTKASNGQEKLVCADRELSKLDVDLSQAYSKARDKSTDKNTLKKEQLEWIKYSLRACSDKNCLISSYKKRISELQ